MTAVGHDLVVIGSSAGGVDALLRLLPELPADLPATVLVGLHLSHEARSLLPAILSRRTRMSVVPASDGLPLRKGQIVVAVPDRHLLVVDDHVVLGHGARENGHRPSHDAMMRSAALARGPRAVGLVLTGLLDDGAAGLECLQRYGGHCLVQDPSDAAYPDMPRNALLAVPSAQVVPLSELAKVVQHVVADDAPDTAPVDADQRVIDATELSSALGELVRMPDGSLIGEPSPYACPSCHGVLNHMPDDRVLRFRCRTGHAWTAESLVAEQDHAVEEAIWSALRALEERSGMASRLADRAEQQGRDWSATHFRAREHEADSAARTLRGLLESNVVRSVPVLDP